ncbi:hypothetical protein QLX67_11200, partial [Balneolaceae bacterium ANBcel3]|nr:hypothetical protein [Balneolaceae bacterium ANBcel3]
MPAQSPFDLVVINANEKPTMNEATIPVTRSDYTLPLGLYYYYTGAEQTISLRLMASGGEDGSINMVQNFYPEGSGQNPT